MVRSLSATKTPWVLNMELAAASNCSYDVSSTYLILKAFELPISERPRNVTELIQNCPNVCNVVVGYGNPDLAGIGVS